MMYDNVCLYNYDLYVYMYIYIHIYTYIHMVYRGRYVYIDCGLGVWRRLGRRLRLQTGVLQR